MDPSATSPTGFDVMFVVVCVIIGLGFVFVIGSIVYRARRIARSGHNPLTLEVDLATKVLDSDLLKPSRSKADRLAEVDRLLAAGTITDVEREAARARILAE